MNKFTTLLICLAATACTIAPAPKEQSQTYTINETLCVHQQCDMEWILRYDQSDVAAIKERATTEASECDVLFFGSSSIRMWSNLHEDFAPLRVVNRGYGGATLRDMHYNYPTVMAHYNPKAFVFYCDNDLRTDPKVNITVGELFDLYRQLFDRIAKDYPGKPVYVLAMKHCKHREAIRDRQAMFNNLLKEYASISEQVTFVDTAAPMLTEDGQINTALFLDDNLHLNADGYKRWTALLKPMLLQYAE